MCESERQGVVCRWGRGCGNECELYVVHRGFVYRYSVLLLLAHCGFPWLPRWLNDYPLVVGKAVMSIADMVISGYQSRVLV